MPRISRVQKYYDKTINVEFPDSYIDDAWVSLLFDDVQGTKIVDQSGNGHHAINNGATIEPFLVGNGATLDGATDYIDSDFSEPWFTASELWITATGNFKTSTSAEQFIWNSGGDYGRMYLKLESTGEVTFGIIGDDDNTYEATTTGTYNDGSPYLYRCEYKRGDHLKLDVYDYSDETTESVSQPVTSGVILKVSSGISSIGAEDVASVLPTDLLDYWFDAADEGTVSGSDFTWTISNKGLSSNDCITSSPDRKCAYGVVTANSLNACSQDTSSGGVGSTSGADGWYFNIDGSRTIKSTTSVFMVAKIGVAGINFKNNDWMIHLDTFGGTNDRRSIGMTYQPTRYRTQLEVNGVNTSAVDNLSGLNDWAIITLHGSDMYLNGTLVLTSGGSMPEVTQGYVQLMNLAVWDSAANALGWSELAIYNDPSLDPGNPADTKLQAIMAHLSAKWGITLP